MALHFYHVLMLWAKDSVASIPASPSPTVCRQQTSAVECISRRFEHPSSVRARALALDICLCVERMQLLASSPKHPNEDLTLQVVRPRLSLKQAFTGLKTLDVTLEDFCVEYSERSYPSFSFEDSLPPAGLPQSSETATRGTSASLRRSQHSSADSIGQKPVEVNLVNARYRCSRFVSSERFDRREREMFKTEELYRQVFRKYADSRGELQVPEFTVALRSLGANVTKSIARAVLVQVHANMLCVVHCAGYLTRMCPPEEQWLLLMMLRRLYLGQLDSDSSGTLNEPDFLRLVQLVTRSQQGKRPAKPVKLEEQKILLFEPLDADGPDEAWNVLHIEYSEMEPMSSSQTPTPNLCARLQVELKRVEASVTVEPLGLLLSILEDLSHAGAQAPGTAGSQKQAHESATVQDDDAGRSNVDPTLVGWHRFMQGIESGIEYVRAHAFASELSARSFFGADIDISVQAGPLDVAWIPSSDGVHGENALVCKIEHLQYSNECEHSKDIKMPDVILTVTGGCLLGYRA